MAQTVLVLRHMPHEAGGTLETALTAAGLEFRYFDLHKEVPARLPLDQASGLVVLGGPMNVDEVDRYPFLACDVQWIEQALAADLPVLGICLGSQLLAKTLGAASTQIASRRSAGTRSNSRPPRPRIRCSARAARG